MKENKYVTPEMETVEVKMNQAILAGSGTEAGDLKGGDDDV